MSSASNNDGSYTLDVTFALGTDINMAQVLVQNRVAIAQPTLPDVVKAVGVTVKKRLPGHPPDRQTSIPRATRKRGARITTTLYLSNYATINLQDDPAFGPH